MMAVVEYAASVGFGFLAFYLGRRYERRRMCRDLDRLMSLAVGYAFDDDEAARKARRAP